MLNALIPIELNLASNIALRYACQKAGLLRMGLQPIHVEEPDGKAHSSQSGWIRRTWETGLQEAGREEVQRILNSEKLDCVVIPQAVIAVGDRNEAILDELRRGSYDLFIEGVVTNFNLGEFRKLLRSKLYKRMSCPVLMVKNLIMSPRVLLLLDEETDVAALVEQFCHLVGDPEADFDLCVYEMEEEPGDKAEQILRSARELLEARGRVPADARVLRGAPEAAAEEMRDYGLLVSTVDRKSSRKSPLTEVLGRVPCPLLLCW
ncbi:adenine nucleotide alpha hydrolase family protein [Paucidesulfovibrio longus]|uniref:universal stress protein n=1 Tax=Paucidesulfovibrio longus TaxID=889 RepID=UPI0003B35DB0|nr:universal stress protein [Paucidesulfovibrio longus]